MPHTDYNDFPFEEVARAAEQLVAQGATVYQKWTCIYCGERLAMDRPNVFYTEGRCEHCGNITFLMLTGCNYLVIWETQH